MTAMNTVGTGVRAMGIQTSASGTTRGAAAAEKSTGFSALFESSDGHAGSSPETMDTVNSDAFPATPGAVAASLDQPISAERSTKVKAAEKIPGIETAKAVHPSADMVDSKGARDTASSDGSGSTKTGESASSDRTLKHATHPSDSDQGRVDIITQGPGDLSAAMPTTAVAADAVAVPHELRGRADKTLPALASSGAARADLGKPSVVDLEEKPVDRSDDTPSPPVVAGMRVNVRESPAPTIDLPAAFAAPRPTAFQSSMFAPPTAQVLPGHHSADGFGGPLLMLARDVVQLSGDADVHFNVRPETLGPVAVTIARGEDGARLHLGVESQTALQAVRQAEPRLTDSAARSGAPFVNVTVDLNAREQRGRSQTAVLSRRSDRNAAAATQPIDVYATRTGRFA
jgi:Flagellar hook-length control protein FliK